MEIKKTKMNMNMGMKLKEIRYGPGYPTTHIIALTGHPPSVPPIGPQLLPSTYEL